MSADREILSVSASPVRRWAGILTLAVLALLLAWVALAGTAPIAVSILLLAAAAGAAWIAVRFHRATGTRLILTSDGLRTGDGEVLAEVGNIERIERGAFAFKPSNGFLVRLKTPGPRRWEPGLWWRAGTHVGVGGALPSGQARALAELLQAAETGALPDVGKT